MAVLPSASVSIDNTAGAFAGGTGYLVVIAAVATSADIVPRVFTSTKALLAQHGYSAGADFCALHFDAAKQPVIFVGLPIVTAGTIGRQNSTGVLGTSVVSVAAATSGVLEETDSSLTVVTGGTIGTNGITFNYSADGGKTFTLVRLITASSYTVPSLGIVINFGAGTLLAGDTYTFSTTAPMWDSAGMAAAKVALANQQKLARSFLVIGDVPDATTAGYVTTALNSYETATARFCYARVQVRDQLPLAAKSKITKTMTGAPSITFSSTTTITRATGSFVADGFVIGDVLTISGSASNNGSKGPILTVSATVITVAAGITAEGPIGTVVLTGSEGLVFAATSITRSVGSWLTDGFRVGDTFTSTGTASNNYTKVITVLTATVLTFASGGAAETIGSALVTLTKGETQAAYVSLMDSGFASVDAQKRIDLGLGRLRKLSPITGWQFRRPVQWAASIREYQHDLQIPCWRVADGPLDGWSALDVAGNTVVEYDERNVGGALAARFTCSTSLTNGPNGAFIALSLTRDTEGSILSRTHNLAVANLACTIVQAETTNAIGQVLQTKADGTAEPASLEIIEARVNTALNNALLQTRSEGKRASSAVWAASRVDILNVPGAALTGVLSLRLDATLEKITTTVRINAT